MGRNSSNAAKPLSARLMRFGRLSAQIVECVVRDRAGRQMHLIIIALLVLLIVLVAGPWVLAILIALLGATALALVTLRIISAVIVTIVLSAWILLRVFRSRAAKAAANLIHPLNGPLDTVFKATTPEVAPFVWQSGNFYLLEVDGVGYRAGSLEAANKKVEELRAPHMNAIRERIKADRARRAAAK